MKDGRQGQGELLFKWIFNNDTFNFMLIRKILGKKRACPSFNSGSNYEGVPERKLMLSV